MPDKPHKLAAIVFTDIVGYTKSMDKDEQHAMQLLQKQREIVVPLVEAHDGKIIKEIGDGNLIMFLSAIEAVRFAIGLQKRLKDDVLTIRAGIHIGDVIFKDDDIFGSAVNMAARIEPLAPPNGIYISEDVRNQVRNKEGIQIRFIGSHELKGIDEPVKVYEINPDEFSSEGKNKPILFYKDLWSRRVIHILALYLILTFLIKQAVVAMVYTYLLSPHLIDLAWIILLSLSPSVFILSYYHTRRSRQKLHKVELIGLPVNLIASALLLLFFFKGKDLGAATTSLTFKNEDGETIEHTVIKSEFRKKIALFFYENKSEDTSLFWIQYAIPSMLDYDLSQNMFIQAQCATEYVYKFRDAGYDKCVEAPLMLQREIAGFYNFNYFVAGQFDYKEDRYIFLTKLYKTENGKLITEFETDGKNKFELIDEISVRLYSELEIPLGYLEESNDLPISEIYTASPKATEYYIKGEIEVLLNNDWDKATHYTELALTEDPGFALALLMLSEYYFNKGQADLSELNLQKTMEIIYKLPERSQFLTKFFYYLVKQEPDKAIAVLEIWTELFPEDIEAHDMLAVRYQYRNMFSESIEEYKMILDIDPGQTLYIRYIGDLFEALGKYDSAIYYYNLYAELQPEDFKAYRNLGELYLNMGDFELAAKNLDKALIIEPTNIDISLGRIKTSLRLGNHENIVEKYNTLLEESTTTNDSCQVYSALSDYYEKRGQVIKSLFYYKKFVEKDTKITGPLNHLVNQVFAVEKYTRAGEFREACQLLKDIEMQLQPPVDKVVSFGYLLYYIELDSAVKAESYIPAAKELAINFGEDMLLSHVYFAQGKIHELTNEFAKALVSYNNYQNSRPSEAIVNLWKARCYRQLKENNEAEKSIQLALKHDPFNPESNYEAARIYKEKGKQDKVIEHLNRCLNIWEDADKDFEPALKAKEALAESSL
ncbi:MAG: tetratricopeptide repeat protein [Bacteroidales bacterium]|nr:tetratricopeptide repeat protein [Bacteroidales bacterium]